MKPLKVKTATAEARRAAVRSAHWIEPELVCEVAFMEFTAGVLPYPSYRSLRLDKKPAAVVIEVEAPVAQIAKPVASLVKISNATRAMLPVCVSANALSRPSLGSR
jgi:bifunctional non-homologous end joining protein LigD